MNIFKTIARTFNDKAFYVEARNYPIGKVIGYYAKLSLLLGALAFIFGLVTVSPAIKDGVETAKAQVFTVYPPDLVLTVSKGVVSTNSSFEPVFIEMPAAWKADLTKVKEGREIDNIAIIDTNIPRAITIDEFKALKTAVFIGKDYMITSKNNDSVSYQSLSNIPELKIDKALIEKVLGFASFLWIALPILFFIGTFIGTFFSLVILLLVALIFLALAHIMKRNISYKESYKSVVYASTWPAILLLLLSSFGFRVSFIFSLLTLLVAVYNLPPQTEASTLE